MHDSAWRQRVLQGVLAAGLAACAAEPTRPAAGGGSSGTAALRATVLDGSGRPGDTVAIRIGPLAGVSAAVGAFQLRVAFDAAQLRYVGQVESSHLVMVNAGTADEGALRLSAVIPGPGGLPADAVDLRFVRRQPADGPSRWAIDVEEVDLADLTALAPARVSVEVVARGERAPFASAAPLTAEDWLARLEPGYERVPRLGRKPGDGAVFGDANVNGVVSSGDLVIIANVSVGNRELLTNLNEDLAVAGNPAPLNLPGLGEPDDPLPPGLNADGTRTITSGDQLVVANYVVGNLLSVVGQRIPGRPAPGTERPRVVLTDADSLRADRRFTRDTVYEIRGSLWLGYFDAPPGGTFPTTTLTIEAGTRVEFDPATNGRLIVGRGARLVTRGTPFEPVVLTCASVVPAPGCWGGVHVNGLALTNTSENIGSPKRFGRGGTGAYGGVQVESGGANLRYTRIEWAGRPDPVTGDTLAALQLLGVGTGGLLDHVQVTGAAGDGLFVSGGGVRMRYVVVSDGSRHGLTWDDGWTGRGQFILIRQGPLGLDAIRGSGSAVLPASRPLSAPVLSHVTIVGPEVPPPNGRSIRLLRGSGGLLLNVLALRSAPIGFDVDGEESCALFASNPDSAGLAAAIVAQHPTPWAVDVGDCIDEVAYATDPSRRNRAVEPGLNAPFVVGSPDLRPLQGAAATTGDSLPPDDGFFDRAARWVGAVGPANLTRNNVPWYAGWTRF